MRKALEAAGIVALIVQGWMTYRALYGPDRLPERVPTHFDVAGNPNGWGSPAMMVVLPFIAAAIYLTLTMAAQFPGLFHYPVRPTARNLPRMQELTLDLLAWIKVEMVCLFAVLQWVFIQSARSGEGHLFSRVLPVALAVFLGTVGWHLVALIRAASGTQS